MSDKPTPKERKDATDALRELHQPVFEALGIPEAIFIPKMAYQPKELEGVHMGFFESELNHGEDVYTECVSMQMEPEDSDRTLYKWRRNPHYKEEYATSEPTSNGSVRYFIPLVEMKKVTMADAEGKEFNLVNPDEDCALDSMTGRDLAALLLKKPVSKKKWINELIES